MSAGNIRNAMVIGMLATTVQAEQTNATGTVETPVSRVYTGGEIIVTAERIRPVELAGTTRSLDAAALNTRGSRNLAEALGTMPGIYSRIGNDGVERIDIRGFRTRHVNLLLNGAPLNNTYDGQFDAALIPVESIGKIKVGYGNQSVLYGSGGLGGVINVITKKGEPGLHGSGEIQAGEGERYIARGTLSQASEKMDVFVGASHAEQDHFNLSEKNEQNPGGKRENSDYDRNNVLGSATVYFDDDWALGMVATYMQGDFGKPPNLGTDKDYVSKPKYLRVEDYEGYGGQVTLNRTKNDDLSIRSALFYHQLSEDENRYDDDSYSTITDAGSYMSESENYAYGANLQLSRLVWTDAHLTLAGTLKCEQYKGSLNELVASSSGGGSGGGGGGGGGGSASVSPELTRTDRQLCDAMLGAELEQQLFDDWVMVGGLSQNWQQDNAGNIESAPSYMLGTTYDLFDATMLHASYAHQIRFPSVKQLYDLKGGNPGLTTETSDNYELGLTQGLGEKTNFDITGFVRDVDDYIEKIDDGSGTETNLNHDSYLFYGAELTLKSSHTDSLDTFASYTYLKTDDRSPNSEREELQYRPEHVAMIGGEWTVLKHLRLYGDLRYVANQYYYSRNTPLQKAKLDNYLVANLRATLDVGDMLHVYVGVDNAFDENYEQSYGVPRAGRTFYAGIKGTF